VLNYAIKMIPARLNDRAKRLFAQEAVNLALAYPYLAPMLGEHVFAKHAIADADAGIAAFTLELLEIGIRRIYPDAIAHALYYALKHDVTLSKSEDELREIIVIDDCICHVLLLEYANRRNLQLVRKAVMTRAANLKGLDAREQDSFWLLIYQTWTDAELRGNGQDFLADLKAAAFAFLRL
jgi:hypothetical protein